MTKRLLYFFGFVLLTGLFSVIILTSVRGLAQDEMTPVPTHPDGPSVTANPDDWQAELDAMATTEADRASRSIFDYPSAYLVSEEAAQNDSVFPTDQIVDMTGAQVFHNWEDFAAANAYSPFEIVLLHHSMTDAVNREWASQAFRDEVMFMGLNVSIPQLGELVSIPCFTEPSQPVPEDLDWINMFGYLIDVENEDYYEAVKQSVLENCENTVDTGESAVMAAGFAVTTIPLMEPDMIEAIPEFLIAYTMRYGKPNRSIHESILPLPVQTMSAPTLEPSELRSGK